MSRRIDRLRRADGGEHLRILVSGQEHGQALRGLHALGAELGMAQGPRPRRARTDTPATIVAASPSMAELDADAWRRCFENSRKP
jgi:hypothetical protein